MCVGKRKQQEMNLGKLHFGSIAIRFCFLSLNLAMMQLRIMLHH
jgi:hypothetical protein